MDTVVRPVGVDEADTKTAMADRPCVDTHRLTRRVIRMTDMVRLLADDLTLLRPCEETHTTATGVDRLPCATTHLLAAVIETISHLHLPVADRRWTIPRATSRPVALLPTTLLHEADTATSPHLPVAVADTMTFPRLPAAAEVPAALGTPMLAPRAPATTTPPVLPLPAGTKSPPCLLRYIVLLLSCLPPTKNVNIVVYCVSVCSVDAGG